MSRRLPEFTATGGFTEQQVVSTASQGQSLTALGQRVASIGQKIFRQGAIKRAQDLGEVAGLQENLRPKPAFTDAQRAFNKAAIEAHKGILATDLTRNAEQIRFEVWNAEIARPNPSAKHALNSFTTRWAAYMQTTMENVPAGNRAFAFNYGNNQGARHQMFFQNQEIAQATRMTQMEYAASDSALSTAAQNQMAIVPWTSKDPVLKNSMLNAALGFGSQRIEMAKKARAANVISEAQAENTIKQTNEQMRDLPIVGNYRVALEKGSKAAAKFIKDLNDRQLPNSKPLWARISAETSHFKQGQIIQGAQLTGTISDALNSILKRGFADGSAEQLILSTGTPAQIVEYQREKRINKQAFDSAFAIQTSTPGVQEKLLAATREKLSKTDEGLRSLEKMETILNDQNELRKKSPKEFNERNPNIVAAVNRQNINAPLTKENKDVINNTGQVPIDPDADRKEQILQLHQGTPWGDTEISTPAERRNWALLTSQARTGQDLKAIKEMMKRKHPGEGQVQQLQNEMIKDKTMSIGEGYFFQIDPDTQFQTSLNEALQESTAELGGLLSPEQKTDADAVIKEFGIATSPTATTGLTGVFQRIGLSPSTLSKWNSWRESLGQKKAVDDQIKNLMPGVTKMTYALMKNKHMSATDAFATAVGLIADRFNYISLLGRTVRIKKDSNVSNDSVRGYADKIEQNFIKRDGGFAYKADLNSTKVLRGNTRSVFFQGQVKNGYWQTTPDNKGMHWILANGTLMVDAKGHDLRFTWEDAKSGNEVPTLTKITNLVGEAATKEIVGVLLPSIKNTAIAR